MDMRTGSELHRSCPGPASGSGAVATWRRDRLVEAGFGQELAMRLSTTPGIDLHALLNLVDRGCPPELAAKILEPLTERGF